MSKFGFPFVSYTFGVPLKNNLNYGRQTKELNRFDAPKERYKETTFKSGHFPREFVGSFLSLLGPYTGSGLCVLLNTQYHL